MSSVYNGVAASGTNPQSASITIPSDGDAGSAASVDGALQQLVNYVANIGTTITAGPLAVVATTANGVAISGTGNGTGAGVSGTGGSSNGNGGNFTGGSTNGNGAVGNGTGTGVGLSGIGGSSGGQGGKFAPYSLSAPVVGAVNLAPVSATPTTPVNGDIWAESGGLGTVKAYVGSSLRLLAGNPACAYVGASTSLTNGTITVVSGFTSDFDTDSAFNGTTGVFTIPTGKGGRYLVTFSIQVGATMTSGTVQVAQSGTVTGPSNVGYAGANSSGNIVVGTQINGSFLCTGVAGKTIQLSVVQTSGITWSLGANTSITIAKVGD